MGKGREGRQMWVKGMFDYDQKILHTHMKMSQASSLRIILYTYYVLLIYTLMKNSNKEQII